MYYKRGELSIRMTSHHEGRYCCEFEIKSGYWKGYTNNTEIYDYFNIAADHLYWSGVTTTLKASREMTRWAWRAAYNVARSGEFHKY